jgi:hypothetical protein
MQNETRQEEIAEACTATRPEKSRNPGTEMKGVHIGICERAFISARARKADGEQPEPKPLLCTTTIGASRHATLCRVPGPCTNTSKYS